MESQHYFLPIQLSPKTVQKKLFITQAMRHHTVLNNSTMKITIALIFGCLFTVEQTSKPHLY